MDPRISIITATRNLVEAGRVDMISRCVHSVSRLSTPHEHIIQDAASTDGTRELLSSLQTEVPHVIVLSESDRGIYDAFNKAVCRAKGKWIFFLGSDDYLFDAGALDIAIEQAERAGVEFVISLVRNSDGSCWFDGVRDFANILIIKSYGHQGVLMTRDLILRLGMFDSHLRIAADYKICLCAHLANVRHLLYMHAFTEFAVTGGISNSNADERTERLHVAAEVLRLKDSELPLMMSRQLLPLRCIFRLMVHPNPVIRQGARYAFARRCANVVCLLDENGGPKSVTSCLLLSRLRKS